MFAYGIHFTLLSTNQFKVPAFGNLRMTFFPPKGEWGGNIALIYNRLLFHSSGGNAE